MELFDSTAEWRCYRPEKEFSKGHLAFYFADKNNLSHRKATIEVARKYGKGCVDLGLANDYYMYTNIDAVHIAFRYDTLMCSMVDFMEFIKNV